MAAARTASPDVASLAAAFGQFSDFPILSLWPFATASVVP